MESFLIIVLVAVMAAQHKRTLKRLLRITDELDRHLRNHGVMEPRIPKSKSLRKSISHAFVFERIEAQLDLLPGKRSDR